MLSNQHKDHISLKKLNLFHSTPHNHPPKPPTAITHLLTVVTSDSGHKQVIITPTNPKISEMIEDIKANRLHISNIPIIPSSSVVFKLQRSKPNSSPAKPL
jgi:hypothetical protein